MDAKQILAVVEPEGLFGPTEREAKERYRALIKEWHPDGCHHTQASAVSAHINDLYRDALALIRSGSWTSPDTLTFTADNGTQHTYTYDRKHKTEYGYVYVGAHIIYHVKKEYMDLFLFGRKVAGQFIFGSTRMRKEFEWQLPVNSQFITSGDDGYVVSDNTRRGILLADLITHCDPIPPKHVAWIISRLLNLRCYLHYAGITHNGIDPYSIVVEPDNHSIALLGPWLYSRISGYTLKALPGHLINCIPASVLNRKKAISVIDGEHIRKLARDMLGTEPNAMVAWAKHPAGKSPVGDYKHWRQHVLPDSFGARKFVILDVSYQDVYGE